jgi:uncharacterized protein (DUF302 family)
MPENGLITLRSSYGFATTLHRLTTALAAKGISIFANIDHAQGAAGVGLDLRPTTLIVFGNPAAGTPLMQAAQTAGIDLPLKALIWQDADGTVNLTYNDPSWVAARHAIGGTTGAAVAALDVALEALARQATGP